MAGFASEGEFLPQHPQMIPESTLIENRGWFEGQGFALPEDETLAQGLLGLRRIEASQLIQESNGLPPKLYATRFESNVFSMPQGSIIKIFHTDGAHGTDLGNFLDQALNHLTKSDWLEGYQLVLASTYKSFINRMHAFFPTHKQKVMMQARNELLARTTASIYHIDDDIFPQPEIITSNGQYVGIVISRQGKPAKEVLPPENISTDLLRRRFEELHEKIKTAGLILENQLPFPSKLVVGEYENIQALTSIVLPGDY